MLERQQCSEGRNNAAHRRRITSIAIIALLAGSGPAITADAKQPPAAKAAAPANVFRDEAARLGALRCAKLFSVLGQTVSNGSAYAVQTQTERAAPDGHGVQGVVGMTYDTPDYRAQAAGVVMAAPVGDRCEGQLVRVAPFQRACKDVVALLPAGSKAAGNLSGVPLYDLGGNQGQAMLVPSGGTCVVVTVARGAEVG